MCYNKFYTSELSSSSECGPCVQCFQIQCADVGRFLSSLHMSHAGEICGLSICTQGTYVEHPA